MEQAMRGTTVKVHYTGKLQDGSIFDSSIGGEPLEFTIGTGQVIPGFEKAILGMSIGDMKTQTILAEDAYGLHQKELVFSVTRDRIPEGLKPRTGQRLQMKQPDGQSVELLVTEFTDSTITLDGNHPLAGKSLVFELQLVGLS